MKGIFMGLMVVLSVGCTAKPETTQQGAREPVEASVAPVSIAQFIPENATHAFLIDPTRLGETPPQLRSRFRLIDQWLEARIGLGLQECSQLIVLGKAVSVRLKKPLVSLDSRHLSGLPWKAVPKGTRVSTSLNGFTSDDEESEEPPKIEQVDHLYSSRDSHYETNFLHIINSTCLLVGNPRTVQSMVQNDEQTGPLASQLRIHQSPDWAAQILSLNPTAIEFPGLLRSDSLELPIFWLSNLSEENASELSESLKAISISFAGSPGNRTTIEWLVKPGTSQRVTEATKAMSAQLSKDFPEMDPLSFAWLHQGVALEHSARERGSKDDLLAVSHEDHEEFVPWLAQSTRWLEPDPKHGALTVGLALTSFHSVYKHLPEYAVKNDAGKPLLSWRVRLLPFLELRDLHNQFRLDEPWDSPHNIQFAKLDLEPYMSSGLKPGFTRLRLAAASAGKSFKRDPTRKQEDRPDATLLAYQVDAENAVPWSAPEMPNDDVRPSGDDGNVVLVLSNEPFNPTVREEKLDDELWQALLNTTSRWWTSD